MYVIEQGELRGRFEKDRKTTALSGRKARANPYDVIFEFPFYEPESKVQRIKASSQQTD